MRAGLLSQPRVIQRINQQFVSTTISADDLSKLAYFKNELAQKVLRHWETPLVLVFLSPEGELITKLTSLKELNKVHPDTSMRPEAPQIHSCTSDTENAQVFLEHVKKHFLVDNRP